MTQSDEASRFDGNEISAALTAGVTAPTSNVTATKAGTPLRTPPPPKNDWKGLYAHRALSWCRVFWFALSYRNAFDWSVAVLHRFEP
jgi:hypothetical protein